MIHQIISNKTIPSISSNTHFPVINLCFIAPTQVSICESWNLKAINVIGGKHNIAYSVNENR